MALLQGGEGRGRKLELKDQLKKEQQEVEEVLGELVADTADNVKADIQDQQYVGDDLPAAAAQFGDGDSAAAELEPAAGQGGEGPADVVQDTKQSTLQDDNDGAGGPTVCEFGIGNSAVAELVADGHGASGSPRIPRPSSPPAGRKVG